MSPTVRAARRFLIALGLVAPLAGAASGRASALGAGPKSLPLTVAGVAVEIPVAGSLDVHTTAMAIALKATATGDLQSIQDHALAIARGLRLPRDNCKHKGLNIVVDSIDEATITRPTAWRRLAHSSAPAAFPTNSSPPRTYLASIVSLACPVCALTLSVETPACVALVAKPARRLWPEKLVGSIPTAATRSLMMTDIGSPVSRSG
jgi:hypothetical protein